MKFNPEMLKLAREQEGLTQMELSKRLGVKQAILSKFEQNIKIPSSEMLKNIAEILKYPIDFFSQEEESIPTGIVFHRKRVALSAKNRNKIEALVKLRIVEAKNLFQNEKLQANIPDGIASIEPKAAADKLRSYWNVPSGPIDNMVKLLETNGIIILKLDFGTDKLDGFFVKLSCGTACIAINSNFSNDRLRFTLAHELGHVVLHNIPHDKVEDEANSFASEFLMPENEIKSELSEKFDIRLLADLKKKWKVSMAALLFRSKSLNKLSDSQYKRAWEFFSACGYRKKEPDMGIAEETPSLLDSIIRKKFLSGFSKENIAKILKISLDRLEQNYPFVGKEEI